MMVSDLDSDFGLDVMDVSFMDELLNEFLPALKLVIDNLNDLLNRNQIIRQFHKWKKII